MVDKEGLSLQGPRLVIQLPPSSTYGFCGRAGHVYQPSPLSEDYLVRHGGGIYEFRHSTPWPDVSYMPTPTTERG